MSFCVIDEKKCVLCGACAAVCPLRIITSSVEQGRVFSVADREQFCIRCGHCMAVCPQKAFTLSSMPVNAAVSEPKSGSNLSFETLDNLLRSRRSIRAYKRDPVAKDIVEKIIDSARYAPSGINRQPVRWAVLYDACGVRRLSQEVINWMRTLVAERDPLAELVRMEAMIAAFDKGRDGICWDAPHLALLYALKDDMTASAACTIAATYFELAAASLGLGTCWAGYVQMAVNAYEPARRAAGIPRQAACFSSLMFGYPTFRYSRIPVRNPARILWR